MLWFNRKYRNNRYLLISAINKRFQNFMYLQRIGILLYLLFIVILVLYRKRKIPPPALFFEIVYSVYAIHTLAQF